MIAALLSTSRHARRHAFDGLTMDRETAYAARELLTFDDDATVRARAAFFLAHAPPSIATSALHDALDDEMPLVRHAAVRALASGDAVGRGELLRVARVALEDPIWWVRRAAVVSSAALGGAACLPTLREALEDPFWRVRSAAVRALSALGAGADDLLERLGPATSARSGGALSYLSRRLGARALSQASRRPSDGKAVELDVPNAIVARLDPDPAVVTARVERGDPVTSAFLVECLGDPHEALRVTARKRLARAHDNRALELALLWLDEPRIPHAAKTVIELLDGLEREDVDPLLDFALERGGFGAVCWAASYVGLTGDTSRQDALLAHAHAKQKIIRCAVIESLGQLGCDIDVIVSALDDRDPRVVRTAVQTLWEHGGPEGNEALARVTSSDPAVRRVLVAAAAEREDVDALRAASSDPDGRARATAVSARASMNDLDASARAACIADPDPWVRIAALDEPSAAHALANDPQPWVRRAAFRVLAPLHPTLAGELASRCEDPWLQTRAAALLDPRVPEQLVALLRLARDASQAVRAAAADALERSNVDDGLDALLASPGLQGEAHASVRIAALAHRSRHFEDADFERLNAARATETLPVRAWLDDVLGNVHAPETARATTSATRTPNVENAAPLRPLGATGIRLSALVVSGAGMLPSHAYVEAMHRGCNGFFWEPRYHTLGRVLARERSVAVVCGSYHATERAIVSDVERSLRRLRRDTLDVFLLFWARSPARVDAAAFEILSRLKQRGKIRAFGFSTHDRDLAEGALELAWDVIMTRHSAVHPGAEKRLLPRVHEKNTGLIGFSALSYGRALSPTISAVDAYRYSLSQPGISVCLSAPRTVGELEQNLAVASAPPLSAERQAELRAHGKTVHEESRDFARSIRRHAMELADARATGLTKWLDHEDVLDPRFE